MEHNIPETEPSTLGFCDKREVALQITGKRRDCLINDAGAHGYLCRQKWNWILTLYTKIHLNMKVKL